MESEHKVQKVPETMKYFGIREPGDPSVFLVKEGPVPQLKKDQVLLKVAATAINRAETLQRKGGYPPVPGTTDIIGLECSGYLVDSSGKIDYSKKVMALLPGGGYGEYVAVHKAHVIEVPQNISVEDAAAIPEAFLTAYMILKTIGDIKEGQDVFAYAGASGVGTSVIQLVKHLFKGRAIVTCSGQDKQDFCTKLGALAAIDRKQGNIEEQVLKVTENKGVDMILDCVGPKNFATNTKILKTDSKWVLYGTLGGGKSDECNWGDLLFKRISVLSTTLKTRSDEYKAKLIEDFKKDVIPHFVNGNLKPIIHEKKQADWK